MYQPSEKLVELIYKSAIEKGVFVDLYQQLAVLSESEFVDDALEEKELQLLQHFRQSSAIAQRVSTLTSQKTIAEKIIDQMATAVFVLDAKGSVLHRNEMAEQMLHSDSRIRIDGGQLSLKSDIQQKSLLGLLNDWSNGRISDAKAMLLGEADDKAPIMLLSPADDARRLFADSLSEAAFAVLFIAGARRPTKQKRLHLQELYQLTPAEADITLRMAAGSSIDEIAVERQSKPGTIRSYVKKIFQKTGTSRQAELVALVLQSPLHIELAPQQKNLDGTDHPISTTDKKRQIMVRSYGPEEGKPMLFFHASLSSRFERPLSVDFLYKHNLRLLVMDRAGYGGTSGPVYDSLLGVVADFKDVMLYFQYTSIRLIGIVGGAPYALACAHQCPEMVDEVVLLDGFAPSGEEHKIPDAPLYYKTVPRVSRYFPRVAKKIIRLAAHEIAGDWRKGYENMKRMFNEADQRILDREEVKQQAIVQATESVHQGPEALANDILLLHNTWPFDVAEIKPHCYLVYGDSDPVMQAYAKLLDNAIPNSELIIRPGEGFAAMIFYRLEDILKQVGWIKKP